MRLTIGLGVLATALAVSALAVTAAPAVGPVGWRGDGAGLYPEAEPPTEFSPTKNVVWATPLPAWSNASPVVIEDRIFVCAEPHSLIALEKASGKILWSRANPVEGSEPTNPKPARTHKDNGFTSATPVSDGKRVFAVFGSGLVAAYDIDGEPLWSRFIERPVHPWGHCASPVLAGGRLLVHFETLVALDPDTGKDLWTQPAEKWPDQRKKQWGTPTVTRIGETVVVLTTAGNVIRVEDGKVLHSGLARVTYSSPLVVDGVAYFVDETTARAVRPPSTLEGKPEPLWETRVVKERFYASPVLLDGRLYAISQRGNFSAFDAKTGKEIFREKLLLAKTEKNPNAAYTSVTLGGGSLYFAGMDGSVVVVRPGPEYAPIARNTVEHSLRSNPVFEGTRMYLRAPGKLYCFGR